MNRSNALASPSMNVSPWQTSGHYPAHAPFHPLFPFSGYIFPETSAQSIYVYEAVRELFSLQGFDSVNFGSAGWNPLGKEIYLRQEPKGSDARNISDTKTNHHRESKDEHTRMD
jgi:hypothetical protein